MRCAVVGGGIIGAAVAARLAPDHDVTLYEKEPALAAHQTGHNSGVVHAGLYYTPGSLRARLCRRGVELLRSYCDERALPYDEVGKVVVAHTTDEYERLLAIRDRALANGVPGIRMLDADGLREVEPHARGVAALHSPHTAITDYPAVTRALAGDVSDAGGRILLGTAVLGIDERPAEVVVTTAAGEDAYDLVVACGGLQSDRLAHSAGDAREPRIVPFLGDYHVLAAPSAALVRGLVYPVPDPAYPFLGVHLTRHVDGSVSIGPNAFLSLGRERYRGERPGVRDTLDVLAFGGFWRFAARNAREAVTQARESLGPAAMLAAAQRYVPDVSGEGLRPGARGIRAQAMDAHGQLIDDFSFTRTPRTLHVRNAPSPGATSALAVAEHVTGLVAP